MPTPGEAPQATCTVRSTHKKAPSRNAAKGGGASRGLVVGRRRRRREQRKLDLWDVCACPRANQRANFLHITRPVDHSLTYTWMKTRNELKLFVTIILLAAMAGLSGCGPKINTQQFTGIWISEDGARILAIQSDKKLLHLSYSGTTDAGTAYSAAAQKYAAKSEKSLEFTIGDTPHRFTLSDDGLQSSLTEAGKAESASWKLINVKYGSLPHFSDLKDTGAGVISLKDQEEITLSYKKSNQGGLDVFVLASKGLPDLRLYPLVATTGATHALISNEKDNKAYLFSFMSTADGNITLIPHESGGVEGRAPTLHFTISSTPGGVKFSEL